MRAPETVGLAAIIACALAACSSRGEPYGDQDLLAHLTEAGAAATSTPGGPVCPIEGEHVVAMSFTSGGCNPNVGDFTLDVARDASNRVTVVDSDSTSAIDVSLDSADCRLQFTFKAGPQAASTCSDGVTANFVFDVHYTPADSFTGTMRLEVFCGTTPNCSGTYAVKTKR